MQIPAFARHLERSERSPCISTILTRHFEEIPHYARGDVMYLFNTTALSRRSLRAGPKGRIPGFHFTPISQQIPIKFHSQEIQLHKQIRVIFAMFKIENCKKIGNVAVQGEFEEGRETWDTALWACSQATLASALPAIIAVMSWLVLGEKISGKKMICVFFATLGLVIIACDKLAGAQVSHSFFGDSLVLLSLLPEATYYILCKMHTNSLPAFLISAFLNGINALLLWFILLFSSWSELNISFVNWIVLIVLGLSSGLFYVFWYFGYKQVDGVMASLSTAIMPVATVIIAWIALGEQLTLWQSIGMGMVIFSIAMYAKR